MRVFASIVLASVAEDDSLLLTVQGQSENGVISDDISMLQRDRNKKHDHEPKSEYDPTSKPVPKSKPDPKPKPDPKSKPDPKPKPLPACRPSVQRAIKDSKKVAQLGTSDLDLIICPWFKMVVRQNMEGFSLFGDNACITVPEAGRALVLSGLDQLSARLFAGGLSRVSGMQGLGGNCLNPFALDGVAGEHGFDTGFIDPLPNKDKWYNSVASHAKTGKLNENLSGRQASEDGTTLVTIDDFFASESLWRMNQNCQLQTEVDVVGDIGVTPFPVFSLMFDMMIGEGPAKEVTVKKMFEFTYEGKVDKFPFPSNSARLGLATDGSGGLIRSPITAIGVEFNSSRASPTVLYSQTKDPTFLNVTCQRLGLGVKLDCWE